MDNLSRDLTRLSLILEVSLGQERFTSVTRAKDFSYYYFNRFLQNLTHVFKDFSSSQIQDVNNRHGAKIKILAARQSTSLDNLIVPIPKGMVKSYKDTLTRLAYILESVKADHLKSDLEALLQNMKSNTFHDGNGDDYSLAHFEDAKSEIGALFSKVGLSHAKASRALTSYPEMISVNAQLLDITHRLYPDVLKIYQLTRTLEQEHSKLKLDDQAHEILAHKLMGLAYRISIFAIVMEHIQDLEYGFAKCLTSVIDKA